jgi:hypothetical protein
MAGWLSRMRHRIAELGENDFTLPSLGAQFEPKEVQDTGGQRVPESRAPEPRAFLPYIHQKAASRTACTRTAGAASR